MKKNILASLVLSTLLASPAFAEGFYIGADVGSGRVSNSDDSISFSGNATTFGVHAGYKFSPNLSAEIAYRDHGKVDDKISYMRIPMDASLSATSVAASVIAAYPFNESFSAYGRLGFSSIKTKAEVKTEVKALRVAVTSESTETRALVGIGAQYNLNKNVSLRTEYTQYAQDLSALTIGANYSF